MFESKETFAAYANIDIAYYMIAEVNKNIPERHGIIKAIDEATGYDKVLDAQLAQELIPCLELVIENKKIIEADFSKDVELLNRSKEALKNKPKNNEPRHKK